MPYPSEHAARILDPKLFKQDSFRRKNITDGIDIILGQLIGETTLTIQAYRFNKDVYTATEAKQWLKDHKINYISFEEATNKSMAHDLKFKTFQVEGVKMEGDSLVIEGWGAFFGNIDSCGDVIQKGAFTKTLAERKDRIAFCYMHDIYNPIGKITAIEERDLGLWLSVKISASELDIQTKVREGILKEMSIGYREINCTTGQMNGVEVKLVNEVMLYEVSLVTIAANPLAVITNMKSEEKSNFIRDEFDRLIVIERNMQKKYELMKLKIQIEAIINGGDDSEDSIEEPEEMEQPDCSEQNDALVGDEPSADDTQMSSEPQLSKSEILKLLLN